ncbi:MAG: Gamma-glutamyl ligase [Cenarchaeum symbiont of Oopsacas minuta]|nr:Gamma-glutamyl ligase [Cenarchaeum symbiont of Oopsacas minuta]
MLTVTPIKASKQCNMFNLFDAITLALKESEKTLQNGDILVVSTKYVSYSQGRRILLEDIQCSQDGRILGKKYGLDENMAEVILRESDIVFGGVRGFVMAVCGKILAPNAGIDMSNSEGNVAILYPTDPHTVAEQLRRKIFLKWHVHVGIILSDSRLAPARSGTTGVAISCSGISPTDDKRGTVDLDGRPLLVTVQATADNIATIANHTMGEGAESMPLTIVRDSKIAMTGKRSSIDDGTVPYEKCLYIRSIGSIQSTI